MTILRRASTFLWPPSNCISFRPFSASSAFLRRQLYKMPAANSARGLNIATRGGAGGIGHGGSIDPLARMRRCSARGPLNEARNAVYCVAMLWVIERLLLHYSPADWLAYCLTLACLCFRGPARDFLFRLIGGLVSFSSHFLKGV